MRSPKCRKGHLKFDTGRRRERRRLLTTTAIAAFSSLALMPVSTASAQQTTSRVSNARSFDIPSQPLSTALNAFGRQSGLQVTLAASTSQGLRSATVSGTMTADQALARLLSGTGISYRISGGTALVGSAVSAGGSAAVAADGATVLDPISAFGAGPLGAGEIVISSEDLKRKNPANIADVFSGEPGISVGSSLPMSQKVYVHGIEETSLAVTMDGGRQNNKVFHHNGTNLIDPGLLKAVNVDAGVAPADAGPGALAGAIAYETIDARDLLDGDGFGGFVTSSYNFNSDTVTTGISAYGMRDGLEFLGYFNFGNGNDFTAGNGQDVEGTSTDVLSGLGKLAYEFDSGDRFEISHDRIRDDAPRPFRANIGFIDGRPPWEPRVRDYMLDRQNTVFTYTDSTPEGWWDPTLMLAYSRTEVEIPIILPPRLNIPPYPATGTTSSFNGKFENKFSFDMGNVIAGVDFYDDKADLDDMFDASTEKARNVGIYAQARLEPWERTRLSFGARGDTQQFTGTTGEEWNNSGLSGNVSGEYDLIEDLLTAKAGYSHVWAGIPLAENFIMNPNWNYGSGPKPVTADNYILGLEANYNDFTVEGSVFQTDIDDARTPRYAVTRGIEAHDVRSRGFEIGAGYSWGDGFFKVKYANIDVEIDGKPADSDLGTYLAAPAGQIITLQAVHTLTDWGVTFGADAEIALDYDDVADGSKPFEGYQVFNAFVEYVPPERPNLSLRAELKNIFDETYSDRATYGQEFGTVTPLYEPGRSFILTAKATF
ncbi:MULTISPECIES: TonB-dependent receptor [Ensifer]|jgi:hemoglobin/transferrin/lactoferrin receptor protein|uniref:TonB-dependent receptor n=1 Tax=Ensifer TaxID=106591 RepID=UPI0009E955C1|nr:MULTISPECIES: TonB-dependent receptor [Ensifer]MDF8357771.1 TonB-dependent receptor [Ensifer adhaerens]RAS14073.1 hemoglobin/transferrin/lactoferrin receptor protein [Ensifer adhaerens]THA63343.1 TonB-dependent receptor [Ensifer adhaerens]UTV39901.1 TonB-dependent receptor [Ensifer adhaerens]